MRPKRYSGGAPFHQWEIFEHMGLRRGHRLPDSGHPEVLIGAINYKILPKGQGLSRARKAHRTVAQCPYCGDWRDAGHIHQHFQACPANYNNGSQS